MTPKHLNPDGHPLTPDQKRNLQLLADKITILEIASGLDFYSTSGFRTKAEQQRINPVNPRSCHTEGLAVDVADKDKKIWDFVIDNLELVVKLGFYLENKLYTPRHVHFQLRAPRSRNRIFIPY